jgi:glycosyl transferase family 1
MAASGRERSARRVLIVGPRFSFKPSYGIWPATRSGLMFYSFAHRLANGFIRNGHFVFSLDDRDYRRQALGWRAAGTWLADRRLLQVARELRPDLVCLQHCDLISPATIHCIREMLPQTRIAVVYYDNIFEPASADRFRRFQQGADFAFATTAGPSLAAFADACPVAFIPNPVDLSIDNASAYAVPRKSIDVFCACGVGGASDRWELIDELRRLRPGLRYSLYGRNKQNRIYGDAYYRVIRQSKIGLNLNRAEGDLYASDRMAQYLGNGVLLATSRRSGYQAYFGDDEMLFFDDAEELADRVGWAVSADHRWRAMAEKARANAAGMMGGERVTDFILRMTLGQGEPEGWRFSDQIYLRPARKIAPACPEALEPGATLVPQYS